MEIINKEGEFRAIENDKVIGHINYSLEGNQFNILHTEVDAAHRGEGIGEKLVAAAMSHAEDNNYRVMPYCTYAKKIIEKSGNNFDDIVD